MGFRDGSEGSQEDGGLRTAQPTLRLAITKERTTHKNLVAIIGAGTIGVAIANGLVISGRYSPQEIILTRRKVHLLAEMQNKGFIIESDNCEAVRKAEAIIVSVEPHQFDAVLAEIAPELVAGKHTVISVVTGGNTRHITRQIPDKVDVVRAMPNTAIAVRESMTCLASIEIGFNSADAIAIASQTAKGAAALLLTDNNHPEYEIDRVTTPKGCTIAGLNQMEHEGFSSAMVTGIVASANKASELYRTSGDK